VPLEVKTLRFDLKREIIDHFIDVIGANNDIARYCDIEELRGRLEENFATVGRYDFKKYGLPRAMMACVLGKNMMLQVGQRPQSYVAFHETLHMASSTFHENNDGTTTWKSGLEENKAPSEFFSLNIDDLIERNSEFESQIETGSNKGINEGITQWLTRLLVGTEEQSHFNPFQKEGMYFVEDNSYPGEQTLIEEFAVFYGKESLIRAYFENSPELLVEEIGRSGNVQDAEKRFQEFSSLMDDLVNCSRSGKPNKKYMESFKKCQNYFLDNFVNIELDAVLETGDTSKILSIIKRIEQLQQLVFKVDGKNVFDDISKKTNDTIEKLQLDIEPIKIEHESITEKIKRKIEELVSPTVQVVQGIKKGYEKRKNDQKLIAQASVTHKSSSQDVRQGLEAMRKAAEERRNNISGLGNLTPEEKEMKYREASLAWEERKTERHGQKENTHEHNSDGISR